MSEAEQPGAPAPLDLEVSRHAELFDDLEIIVVVLAPTGNVAWVNRYFCERFGVERAATIGSDWFTTFVRENERDQVRGVFAALLAGEGPRHYTNPLTHPDGGHCMVEWNNTVLRDPGDEAIGTLSLGCDVSLRDGVNAALADQQAREEAILEAAVDGIITIDEDGIISSFNRAAAQLFGYEAAEVIGKNVKVLMPEPYREEHDGYIRNYVETRQARIIGIGREVTGRRKDGSLFPVYLSVSEVHLRNRRIFTGIVRDLTAMRRAQRLAELGTMSSGIAHEIGTPMNVILGRAEFLRDRSEEARTRKGLQVIIDQVERITRIMRQLLTFARKQPMMRRDSSLNAIVESTLELVHERLEKRGIALKTELDDSLGEISIDPDRIGQALLNLIVNAIHAMADGGELTVRTGRAQRPRHGRNRRRSEVQLLSITDTGCGIDSDELERIFDPFYTTKGPGLGTGLGLSVVQGTVREHDGDIEVDSRLSEGTTFAIYLPEHNAGRHDGST